MPVIPALQGSTSNRTVVQVRPGEKRDPISKITNTKRAGGVAQVVEHPPSHEFIPCSAKKKVNKKKKKKKEEKNCLD
jgi:hypothetical protein